MTSEGPGGRSAVIVVSSHVARGAVGNRAAVFALQQLGFPVWAVPTVVLPWHPGHGPATRIVPDPGQFAALVRDLESSPWIGEVGAVLSGYLGDADQAVAVASLVSAVDEESPQLGVGVILGDRGDHDESDEFAVSLDPERQGDSESAVVDFGTQRVSKRCRHR